VFLACFMPRARRASPGTRHGLLKTKRAKAGKLGPPSAPAKSNTAGSLEPVTAQEVEQVCAEGIENGMLSVLRGALTRAQRGSRPAAGDPARANAGLAARSRRGHYDPCPGDAPVTNPRGGFRGEPNDKKPCRLCGRPSEVDFTCGLCHRFIKEGAGNGTWAPHNTATPEAKEGE
jgi:hypothetical protein